MSKCIISINFREQTYIVDVQVLPKGDPLKGVFRVTLPLGLGDLHLGSGGSVGFLCWCPLGQFDFRGDPVAWGATKKQRRVDSKKVSDLGVC